MAPLAPSKAPFDSFLVHVRVSSTSIICWSMLSQKGSQIEVKIAGMVWDEERHICIFTFGHFRCVKGTIVSNRTEMMKIFHFFHNSNKQTHRNLKGNKAMI